MGGVWTARSPTQARPRTAGRAFFATGSRAAALIPGWNANPQAHMRGVAEYFVYFFNQLNILRKKYTYIIQ